MKTHQKIVIGVLWFLWIVVFPMSCGMIFYQAGKQSVYHKLELNNGCVIDTIIGYHKLPNHISKRILLFYYRDYFGNIHGHAYLIYQMDNTVYAYDGSGSRVLKSLKTFDSETAHPFFIALHLGINFPIVSAWWNE